MMALGFAMVATATAGPVIHADGMNTAGHRPITIAGRSSNTQVREPRPGFYESLTLPAALRG